MTESLKCQYNMFRLGTEKPSLKCMLKMFCTQKFNLKWIKGLNARTQIIKLREENIE